MPLDPGSRLGPYEILEPIGAGGMGEVYKARDTRLDRVVAVKTLKPAFLERFGREAKTIASLNHPNICALYDVGANYLVMEYVEGQTLDSLIPKHGMRLSDALRIASQAADGLSHAHAAGVVHRDLKPSNLMVTPDGTVKILDFGLAKSVGGSRAAEEDTQTVTQQGTIVGTVAYMSPEQAEGRKLDARSDIFSFGAMLYEMITGRRAFHGESNVSTLAAILHTEPKTPENIPPQVEQIIRRCLRKDPIRRWQATADLKVALDDAREESLSGVTPVPASVKPRRLDLVFLTGALLLALCAAGAAWWWTQGDRSHPNSFGPLLTRLTSDSGLTTDPTISPDGKLVAFASDRAGDGGTDIWLQQIAGGEPIRITRHPANDLEPSFSPDSGRIAFRSDRDGGGIYVVSTLGGEERLIARHGHAPRFSPDGQWIAYRRGEEGGVGGLRLIDVVPAAGGAPKQLPMPVTGVLQPVWSPDSKAVFVAGTNPTLRQTQTCLLPIDGSAPICTPVDRASWAGLAAPFLQAWIGDEIYFAGSLGDGIDLYRRSISARGALKGKAERLTAGTLAVRVAAVRLQPNGAPQIVFAGLNNNLDIWLLAGDTNRGAMRSSPERVTTSPAAEFGVFVLQEPSRIGYQRVLSRNRAELCIRDLRTGVERAVLQTPTATMLLSPDGAKAAYLKDSKIYMVAPPDPAPQEVSDQRGRPDDWTRDGRYILLAPYEAVGSSLNTRTIRLVDVVARKTNIIAQHPHWLLHPSRFSPDGRWFCFFSTNSAVTRQIFVAPFHRSDEAKQEEWIAVTDGKTLDREPRWSPDGNMIYFLSERDGFRCIWAQRLQPASKRPSGDPFPVFHAHSARLSMDVGNDTYVNGLAVTEGKIYVTMAESTGNLWLAQW